MKALLVADDEVAIENISQVLKSKGYDTIVYKWLLKALDNIEEIAPHLIVVSTLDYPRHWKTLAQYAKSGFGDYTPQLILFTDENFGEEEKKKAEFLNVRGTFDSVGVEGLDKLREILEKNDDIFSGRDIKIGTENGKRKVNEEVETEPENLGETGNTEEQELLEELDEDTELSEETDDKELEMNTEAPKSLDQKAADRLEELAQEEEVPTVDGIMSQPCDEDDFSLPGLDELKKLLDENEFAESENDDIIEEDKNEETDSSENLDDSGDKDMADEQSIDEKLAEIMNANKADQKEKAEALKLDTNENSVSFVFTNPITLAMVSGVARNYNGLVLEFTPDIPGFIMNLSPGTKIDIASMKVNDKIENVLAEVMSNDAKKLALSIKKI